MTNTRRILLVHNVYQQAGGEDRVLGALIENVSRSLKKGEKVKLVGFGVFDVARRRARSVLNPRTGAAIRIPARRVPRFTPGKDLRKIIK